MHHNTNCHKNEWRTINFCVETYTTCPRWARYGYIWEGSYYGQMAKNAFATVRLYMLYMYSVLKTPTFQACEIRIWIRVRSNKTIYSITITVSVHEPFACFNEMINCRKHQLASVSILLHIGLCFYFYITRMQLERQKSLWNTGESSIDHIIIVV